MYPGEPRWSRAKLLANAADARATVFVQHLCATHLVIAEAFALSRFRLPSRHPLRPLLDLHSFGCETTIVQRGSTTVVSIDPSAKLNYALYDEGLPVEDCDLIGAAETILTQKG